MTASEAALAWDIGIAQPDKHVHQNSISGGDILEQHHRRAQRIGSDKSALVRRSALI